MNRALKDFWGNDAIDYGTKREMTKKYGDKIIVSVAAKPFGDVYVLFVCNNDEEHKADRFLTDYHALMKSLGIKAYGAGYSLGDDLEAARAVGFMGGAVSL